MVGLGLCVLLPVILFPKRTDSDREGYWAHSDLQTVAEEAQAEFNRDQSTEIEVRTNLDFSYLHENISQGGFEILVSDIDEEDLPRFNEVLRRALKRYGIPEIRVVPMFNDGVSEEGKKINRIGERYSVEA